MKTRQWWDYYIDISRWYIFLACIIYAYTYLYQTEAKQFFL